MATGAFVLIDAFALWRTLAFFASLVWYEFDLLFALRTDELDARIATR